MRLAAGDPGPLTGLKVEIFDNRQWPPCVAPVVRRLGCNRGSSSSARGESFKGRHEHDEVLSSTIGGYYGGYYSLAYDYMEHAPGTLLQFKHVTVDYNKQRTVIRKKVRVKANGGLKILN